MAKQGLQLLAKSEIGAIWKYAPAKKEDANAARFNLGYFDDDGLIPGDVVYIWDGSTLSHHYVAKNEHENKLQLWLIG